MAYLLFVGYIELTIDLPEPDTSEIDRMIGTNVFYVDSLSLCLVTTILIDHIYNIMVLVAVFC